MVNALALVFGEKDYAPFIDYVNTEITHYKREVLGQKSSAPSTSGSSSADSGSSTPKLEVHRQTLAHQVVVLHQVEARLLMGIMTISGCSKSEKDCSMPPLVGRLGAALI